MSKRQIPTIFILLALVSSALWAKPEAATSLHECRDIYPRLVTLTAPSLFAQKLKSELPANKRVQLDTVHTKWETKNFDIPRLPIQIKTIENKEAFSSPNDIRIESMPLKMLGTEIKVPKKIAQFQEAIDAIGDFERKINPHFDQYYMYITTNQSMVQVGKTQRRPGSHSDGFQEDYLTRQDFVDRNYLVSDGIPTEFFDQPFPISHLTNANQVLPEFDKLTNPAHTVTYPPYSVTMMDTYTVHRGGTPLESKYRTFVKVVFSTGQFNREGNTHNELFDYKWDMVSRGQGRNSSIADGVRDFRPVGCSGICSQCNLH